MKAVRFGLHILTYYLVFAVLSLILLVMVGSAPLVLQIIIMTALTAGFGVLLLNDGGAIGEKAVTMSKLVEKRREEGFPIDPENESLCFRKKNALIAFAVAVIPLLLLSAANFIYEPVYEREYNAYIEQYGPIESAEDKLNETVTLENGNIVYPADTSENESEDKPAPPTNYIMVAARIVFSPFLSFLAPLQENLTAYNLLLMLFAFLVPAFGAVGYLNGPKLHEKKLKAIAQGVRRTKRRMKFERDRRQPKGPKHEV